MKNKEQFTFTVDKKETDDEEIVRLTPSSNYYELGVNDREELTDLMLEWVLKEKKTLHGIKNR